MSTQIRYKGKPVATFERGTVTLKTEDFGLEGDIEVVSEGETSRAASLIADGSTITIVAAAVTEVDDNTISIGE